MPQRCLGPDSPYGCGHHTEHVEAARKGWLTRRRGTTFRVSKEHGLVNKLLGGGITHAHEHDTHRGTVVFKQGKKWYQVPRSVWGGFVREGKALEREETREAREYERGRRVFERDLAKIEREEARRKRAEDAEARAQERRMEHLNRQEEAAVRKRIKELGGVKPDKYNNGEIRGLPRELVRKTGKSADRIREGVDEDFPWLNLETLTDFFDYFENVKARRNRRSLHRGK